MLECRLHEEAGGVKQNGSSGSRAYVEERAQQQHVLEAPESLVVGLQLWGAAHCHQGVPRHC